MQITKCDRCKAEIPNKVYRIHGQLVDTTNRGEELDSQILKPKDLCGACVAEIEVLIGFVLFEVRVYEEGKLYTSEDRCMEAPLVSGNDMPIRSHP